MNNNILLYEELSINAHPALQTQLYDGWILRFANGYTNRANSINPIYPSALDLRTKITECEKRYFTQGLSTVYKLTDGSDLDIDKQLEQMGYSIVTPIYVIKMDLREKSFSSGDCVMTCYADSVKMTTAKKILENVNNTMPCGRIVKDGVSVACCSVVIERGYMGILNIVADEPQRGKGYGTEICESLLSAAQRLDAHTAYLQVIQDNIKAVNLYTKLGYKTIYSYWYRVKKGEAL